MPKEFEFESYALRHMSAMASNQNKVGGVDTLVASELYLSVV
jgi:hypothetical protein